MSRRARWAAGVDASAVLAVWWGMLGAEAVALGFLQRDLFSGIWEIALARRAVVPMATVFAVPFALAAVGLWRLARRRSRRARSILAVLGAVGGAALAWGTSGGRHFEDVAVRAAFVAAVAAALSLAAARLGPAIGRLAHRPLALSLLGVGVALGGWIADVAVLPRLYPAMHAALFAGTLGGGAFVAFAARGTTPFASLPAKIGAAAITAYLVVSAARIPHDLALVDRSANLRLVLVEHAPLLGRAVATAMRARPDDVAPAAAATEGTTSAPGAIARSLDWTGRDVLLLTVDALRADHVSAYGYGRSTTPNVDALAREGAVFEHAYCPTPHTSYSVTSLMTGKYLRPLLSMGLGEDSETWAEDLRRYGYRTAAFYPPAVFYIDENRFERFERTNLGFEYAKVEFAPPALREEQVASYLDGAPSDRPLFLWVHFFEPHEPYVMHPEHPFSGGRSADVDAYDSEIATADDGIGRIVRLVQGRRPGAVVIVTADHGEEFGDHGGRYHGSSVYEEQVRVPLVVVGPGVRAGTRRSSVVQTIDLLPTTLSALGMPRPARIRGRDLGPILAGAEKADDDGFAFAETDDYALVATGGDRLVCERRAAACALYRPAEDPEERRDVASAFADRAKALRALLRTTERGHGRYEAAAASAWPEALRRGLQGDTEAAPDVASLLDDADVAIRRKAAEVCFGLAAPETEPELRRALARDEDEGVRRWSALAVARAGKGPVPPLAEALLHDPDKEWRRPAALALGARGDARACDEIAAWWNEATPTDVPDDDATRRLTIDLPHAENLLAATRDAGCRSAVPALLRALDDVRARPYVADTLGALGDDRARAPLLNLLADEPYVTTRPHEARALLALGAVDWAAPASGPAADAQATIALGRGAARLVVLLSDPHASLALTVDGAPAPPSSREEEGVTRTLALPLPPGAGPKRRVQVAWHASSGGVAALWLVRDRPASAAESPAPAGQRHAGRFD